METGSPRLSMKPQPLQLVLEEQVLALQQQMAENQAASWRKLKSSQDAQKRQATLVRKLQAKVRQLPLWERENESPTPSQVLGWREGWMRERPWRGMDHCFFEQGLSLELIDSAGRLARELQGSAALPR